MKFSQNLGCAKFTGFFTGCFLVTGYFTYFSQHFHRFSSNSMPRGQTIPDFRRLSAQNLLGTQDFFFIPNSWHDDYHIFHIYYFIELKILFFFSENTYNTNYSRSVLLYTVSLFKPLRGFNKHQWPTKHVGYFAHRGRLLFYTKKKQLVWITL